MCLRQSPTSPPFGFVLILLLFLCDPHDRSVRLDDIISDITAMGFQRNQIIDVINSMQKSGQAIDLNVVIDRLTNGRY